jgi:hypothetical protein
MQSVTAALAANKVADARSSAATAINGMKSMADLVGPASPAAKAQFLVAADELTEASSQFPGGGSLLEKAAADRDQAFAVARQSKCPG